MVAVIPLTIIFCVYYCREEYESNSEREKACECIGSCIVSLTYTHSVFKFAQVDYVEMDGPTIVIRLKGRFWHQRTTVLDRVANYLQQRIPEIVDVDIEDPYQLTEEANEVW